jgi:hypothetical protein
MKFTRRFLKFYRSVCAPKHGPERDLYFIRHAERAARHEVRDLIEEGFYNTPTLDRATDKQDRRRAHIGILEAKIKGDDKERRSALRHLRWLQRQDFPHHTRPKTQMPPSLWTTRHGQREEIQQ